MQSMPDSDMYFSLVAKRQCGECMVCCKYLSINTAELKKPADVQCENCLSSGCQIYESRPNVCRTWHCLWRRVDAMPPELRPDRSNAIFSLKVSHEPRQIFENAYIVCIALTDPSVFDTTVVSAAIDAFIEEGSLPVWLCFEGSKSLVWPNADLADAIDNPGTTKARHLLVDGKIWRGRYEAMLEPLQDNNAMFGREFLRN